MGSFLQDGVTLPRPETSDAAQPAHGGGLSRQGVALNKALSASHELGPAPPQSPTAHPGIEFGDDMVRGNQESNTKQKGDEQGEAEGSHLEVVVGEDAHDGGPPTRPAFERGRGKGGLATADACEQGQAGCSTSAVSNARVQDRSDCAWVRPGASKTPCRLTSTGKHARPSPVRRQIVWALAPPRRPSSTASIIDSATPALHARLLQDVGTGGCSPRDRRARRAIRYCTREGQKHAGDPKPVSTVPGDLPPVLPS